MKIDFLIYFKFYSISYLEVYKFTVEATQKTKSNRLSEHDVPHQSLKHLFKLFVDWLTTTTTLLILEI